MFDPFSAWSRLVSASFEMAQTTMKVVETINASSQVVSTRSDMIGTAMRSPLDANHRELGRMVPEKVEAFSHSGAAIVTAWWGMQTAWLIEMQHLAGVSMRGRPLTAPELLDLSSRQMAYAVGSVETAARLGSGAVAPIHRKATSNARRLIRPRKRSR